MTCNSPPSHGSTCTAAPKSGPSRPLNSGLGGGGKPRLGPSRQQAKARSNRVTLSNGQKKWKPTCQKLHPRKNRTKKETKKPGQKKYHNHHQPLWTQHRCTNKVDPPGIESSIKSPPLAPSAGKQKTHQPKNPTLHPSLSPPAHPHSITNPPPQGSIPITVPDPNKPFPRVKKATPPCTEYSIQSQIHHHHIHRIHPPIMHHSPARTNHGARDGGPGKTPLLNEPTPTTGPGAGSKSGSHTLFPCRLQTPNQAWYASVLLLARCVCAPAQTDHPKQKRRQLGTNPMHHHHAQPTHPSLTQPASRPAGRMETNTPIPPNPSAQSPCPIPTPNTLGTVRRRHACLQKAV